METHRPAAEPRADRVLQPDRRQHQRRAARSCERRLRRRSSPRTATRSYLNAQAVRARQGAVRRARHAGPRRRERAPARALPHRLRARRRQAVGRRQGEAEGDQRRARHAGDQVQPERAGGSQRLGRRGRHAGRTGRPVRRADRRGRRSRQGAQARRQVRASPCSTPPASRRTRSSTTARCASACTRPRSRAAAAAASSTTRAIVSQVAKLRAERAALLGYPNHAAYVLEDQTAKTPGRRQQAAGAAGAGRRRQRRKRGRRPAGDDRQRAKAKGSRLQARAWDWAYYTEKVRQAQYAFDEVAAQALLRAEQRAAERRVLRRQPAVRPDLQGAHGPAGLPPRRARVRRVRRGRQARWRIFLVDSVRARDQARRRVDERLRRPVGADRHQAGGRQPPQHPQAAAGRADAADLGRSRPPRSTSSATRCTACSRT